MYQRIALALCGHEYATTAKQGRRKKYGDCDCAPITTKARTFQQECLRCGALFHHYRPRDSCSDACRSTIEWRRRAGFPVSDQPLECERCGRSFESKRISTKRCTDCRTATIPIQPDAECPNCGVTFTPFKREQRSCSNRCAQAVWKRENRVPEPWDDRRRKNYQKRRALKLMLPAEAISPAEIFERDGWMCGICAKAVDPELRWPHPGSPTLDHIVPLARGGHHVRENVQLACARCNISKGARVAEIT